jgi:hypothetical protein
VARGGKREGAGRKSGAGWQSPKPAAIRALASNRVREVLTTATDPLSVLVEIAADPGQDTQLRVQAATAACPFMFPRLSASVVATAPASARDDTAGLVDRLMHRFAKLAPPTQTIEGEAA